MREAESESEVASGKLALLGFDFDLESGELRDRVGEIVPVSPHCLAVLRVLARNAGRVVGKEALIRAVWPSEAVSDDSLVHCIGLLRQVLGDSRHRLLQTEHRRGYRLVPARAPDVVDERTPGEDHRAPPEERGFATTVDGVSIAYACRGCGVPIVRAAGEFSHLDYDMGCLTEGPILRAVARNHRLIRYDQRGQGLSDRDVELRSLEDQLRDLQAVVDAQALPRFVLWAIGAAAASAIRFAAQHPERVERLVINAGWARGLARRGDTYWTRLGEAHLEDLEAEWGYEESNVRVERLMTGGSNRYPGATIEQVRSLDDMLLRAASPPAAAGALRLAAGVDVDADLGRIRCPALVTHSRRSRITALDEARRMAEGIPGARLVVLDSANDMPLPGEPAFDELVRLIQDFVAQRDAG